MAKSKSCLSKFSFEKKIEEEYPLSIRYHTLKKETTAAVKQFAKEYREYRKNGNKQKKK